MSPLLSLLKRLTVLLVMAVLQERGTAVMTLAQQEGGEATPSPLKEGGTTGLEMNSDLNMAFVPKFPLIVFDQAFSGASAAHRELVSLIVRLFRLPPHVVEVFYFL